MEKSCKECDNYEFYDGPKLINGVKKAVMYCDAMNKHGKEKIGYRQITTFVHCSKFTPKQPEKPKPTISYEEVPRKDRMHYNCKRGKLSGSTEPCNACLKIGERIFWEPENPKPIEQPKEPEKKCETCGRYWKWSCFKGKNLECGRKDGYSAWTPKEPEKPKPNNKENKMRIGIFKFSVRRYMVLCTALVTARIAIWLNPKIFWLAGMIKPMFEDNSQWEHIDDVLWNSSNAEQIFVIWGSVIIVIFFVCGILWLWNYLSESAWTFLAGEKKS